jgi:hypothetical protein
MRTSVAAVAGRPKVLQSLREMAVSMCMAEF